MYHKNVSRRGKSSIRTVDTGWNRSHQTSSIIEILPVQYHNPFSYARIHRFIHLWYPHAPHSRWSDDMVRDTPDVQEIYPDISQYWYELPRGDSFLSALYSRALHPRRAPMSRVQAHTRTDTPEICTLWIRSIYDIWAHIDECDEVMELEYGCCGYTLGDTSHGDYRMSHVYGL